MSDVDDIARNHVEDAKRLHPHTRDLLARVVAWALIELARETNDERAMDVAFARFAHHKERAAKAPRFAGSRR